MCVCVCVGGGGGVIKKLRQEEQNSLLCITNEWGGGCDDGMEFVLAAIPQVLLTNWGENKKWKK